MIIYLLKSASCLALLLLFYHTVLEKEKMHNFNRFYLLGSILFSFLAPLAAIKTYIKQVIIKSNEIFLQTDYTTTSEIIIKDTTLNYWQIFIGFYLAISALCIFRFGFNLHKIIQKIKRNEKVYLNNATLVLVEDKVLPHTFWSYIFINKVAFENDKIEEELYTHELTHVNQKHTLDVLIIELLQTVFWINPLFIFLKKAVQLNHEFLADENVINQHKNTFQYQHLLLNKAAWNNEYYLASNLNYSLTKKRLKMMTTQSSRNSVLLKKLLVIPLLTGFIFLFAERVESQERQEKTETIDKNIPFKKIKNNDLEIYRNYIYRNLSLIRKDKNGKEVVKNYSDLTLNEKNKLRPTPPLKLPKIVPTKKQIDNLKDSSKYAVWIDGKVVKNEVLNNYKNSDFARYS
jgi:beta-lactamase regulating signal transducer with metallopeptidase domain